MRKRPPHVSEAFYHVMLRGNARQAIFRDEDDRVSLQHSLADALDYYDCEMHAYCWMTNHLHLLLRVSDEPVFKVVRYFATQYARSFNRKYESVGHLFQGRHQRRLVADTGYLKQVVRYIHRNPIEAGIASDPSEYLWSSYLAYLGKASGGSLTMDTVLNVFGRRADAAQRALARFTVERSSEPHPWSTWSEIVADAEIRFGLSEADLCGPLRNRDLTEARCWIVRCALCAELGTVESMAARLGRSANAVRRALKRRVDG
jgi:putative transposase